MKNIQRALALLLVFAMILAVFPAAVNAKAAEDETEECTDAAESEAIIPSSEEDFLSAETAEEESAAAGSIEEYSEVPEAPLEPELPETEFSEPELSEPEQPLPEPEPETEPIQETVETPPEETEAPVETSETIPEETETPETEADPARTALTAAVEDMGVSFNIFAPSGSVFSSDAMFSATIIDPEYDDLARICIDYEIPNILTCLVFDLTAENVSFGYEDTLVDVDLSQPVLMAIHPSTVRAFQVIDGTPLPIPVEVVMSESKVITHMKLTAASESFHSRYYVITSDAPNPLLEVGSQVAYMAVNTINNKRVGLSGNGISFTTSGIMWHYISDQRKPAICLQPNKTFQTSSAAAYHTETTALTGSSTGSVGGNVWDSLTYDQRRAIALIVLYGVQTHWDNSVGSAGLNTGYNLQYPTNPNQCLFAAQQIMTWEIVTGNRSATYPYTCYDSTLINAFGGDVPTKYAWLESQLRAHDSATSTIPSPENSTYRLSWLTSGYQTVIQVLDVAYETPAPPTATLTVRKTSSTATGTDASKQFTFKVFRNAALTSQVGTTQYLAPGRSFSIELDPGVTYYVAEVAESGWNCATSGIGTKTVSGVTYYYQSLTPSAGDSYSITFQNEPIVKMGFTLQKSINAPASCAAMIQNNAMYSLVGAEYSVTMNGVLQETLVTDASGKAASGKTYNIGDRLTIKETKAPKGFKLDTASYTLTISNGSNTVSVSDVPLFDPPFAMTKVDKSVTVPQGNGSFSGAVFRWDYYDNTSWTGTPKATWYFQTNASGRVQYDPSYLASGYTSSSLYSPAQNSYQIPLGSLKITEVKNSLGYAVIQEPLYCTMTEDTSSAFGVAVTWNADSLKTLVNIASGNYGVPEPIDTSLFGSVTVQKCDNQTGEIPQGAASFAGAEFEVVNRSTNAVVIGNTAIAPGDVCMKLTTDASGFASSGNVFPLGKYELRESKAPAGYTLNTEWTAVFTVTETQRDFAYALSGNTACKDEVVRGGLKIIKQDSELLTATGSHALLGGITFSVVNANDHPVVVNGTAYAKGDVVMTLEVKWDGAAWSASSAGNALPYGTYTVKENPSASDSAMANESYYLNAEPQNISIQNAEETVCITFVNRLRTGKIRIEKLGEGKTPLAQVGFLLQWSEDGGHWFRVTKSDRPGEKGGCTSDRLENGILKTNAQGIVEFIGLDAKLQYQITEVETQNGYSLLPEPVYKGFLPEGSYELALRVINNTAFLLPQTGSNTMRLVSVAAALCTICGALMLLLRKKRR